MDLLGKRKSFTLVRFFIALRQPVIVLTYNDPGTYHMVLNLQVNDSYRIVEESVLYA